jgi:CRISPR/Cas system-associated exonuclease Cas4 (RecB family)
MARSKALVDLLNLTNQEGLPIEKQFLSDLKHSIEKEDQKNSRKPSQTYKPSSMHCIRNMYYQAIGAEATSESVGCELIGICESGSDRHERLQRAVQAMKDNNIDCEYCDVAEYVTEHNLTDIDIVSKQGMETKLYHKTLNMSFLCDGIIKYKGKYYILEIKTETQNKFWDRQGVNPDHVLQGTAYSLAFGINQVLFLYECRDNCSKKTFMLDVTDEMRENLKKKIFDCMQYVDSQSVPPKPIDLSKKACAYCGYAERCKSDGN